MKNVVEKAIEIVHIYNGYSPVDISEHIESMLDPERDGSFILINSFKGSVIFSVLGRFNSSERIREIFIELVSKVIERTGYSMEECIAGFMKNMDVILLAVRDKYEHMDNMPNDVRQLVDGVGHTLLSLRNESGH